ncbi:quinone oxidoreductase family protein [Mycobacterium aquaticum]|uniref:quinone oxidoreductase family protein n=1 Tax=Mycobacterium aquaticum TaxID=1927124 RepID=UPI001B80C0EC|nr:zinc-binding dehydrogenase [Mycobacterium aquaticum]
MAADRVVVRVTAAGVTPLEHTIVEGAFPRAKSPLVLGNEGAGIIDDAGTSGLAVGSRVAFTGAYGVAENGSWEEYVAVRSDDILPVPEGIDDVVAASLPVAYLTAMITLTQAGFAAGKTVFAPAIGGSVGNATYQLARALGAATVISTAGSAEKARRAAERGYDNVIDLSGEGIGDGVRRITGGTGVDVVIESLGGAFTEQALGALALDGTHVTLGYTVGRQARIDVTDIIWKRARMFGFMLAAQSPTTKLQAWNQVMELIAHGTVVPLVERTYPLERAAEALRYLHEERPFGKIVLEV